MGCSRATLKAQVLLHVTRIILQPILLHAECQVQSLTACQVNGMFGCVLSLVCFVVQVNITRPYLCANHLAAPYTGLPASAAEAPSQAPPPQSASGAAGEGYGAGVLTLLHFVRNCNVAT